MNRLLNYAYTKEKLYDIIEHLATANGDMRQRLKSMSVEIALLDRESFPDNLKDKWQSVKDILYKYPPKKNWDNTREEMNSIEHSLSKIQNRTACKVAETIFKLWEDINKIN